MNRNNQKHSGFTLIELMVVISVTSVLIVMTAAWLNETMKFSARVRGLERHHRQLTRLATKFRFDVRHGESIAVQDRTRLVISYPGGREIVYAIFGNSVQLEELVGNRTRREKYTLARNSMVDWDVSQLPDSIGLVVTRGNTASLTSNKTSSEEMPILIDKTQMLIDLHVNVSVNRWPGSRIVIEKHARGGE